jgi:hypothetical protein
MTVKLRSDFADIYTYIRSYIHTKVHLHTHAHIRRRRGTYTYTHTYGGGEGLGMMTVKLRADFAERL